jgi:transcription termination factor Rho
LDEEKQKQVEMIKKVKQTANDHLDKIESTLMDDLTNIHESSKLEIEKSVTHQRCESRVANIWMDNA